ncbi:bifunctional diguanylate cyclase/phosphodiesterase [Rhizobium sp. L1K21]|uniref:putative bifunctional diguanylate cyclase/phosphodiesterase n=1 Tax=Rhizobium sp. L1K21 TaxID=2954933 RepID=UPI0020937209|nr:EAL domain-containing protein [Rhizobium sp. L1K21]MCO6184842.1 EAL domain-containing protein [Rhizobium sp. L1K21]
MKQDMRRTGYIVMALKMVDRFIDFFAAPAQWTELDERKRVRIFVLSHIFGPVLSLPIPFLLMYADPNPFPHVHMLAASILAFWLFPFLLRRWPKRYVTLCIVSILNLNFVVLWGAYNYGAVSSPFLLWYILIPLLAFFYLGGGPKAQLQVFAQIVLGLGSFSLASLLNGDNLPQHIPMQDMTIAGLLSAFCSTTYAFLMASYYSEIVDNQSELMREVSRHKETLHQLVAAKDEAEGAKELAEARNAELLEAKSRLEVSALHDWLTGLPNRRYLDDILAQYCSNLGENGGSIAVLHIDLDLFKQINDSMGHVAGDAMLMHVAKLLVDSANSDDFVARVGGDEFIIVRTIDNDVESLSAFAATLIEDICQPVPYDGKLCRFGACVGIVVEGAESARAENLLINSDAALYRAKSRGRNRYEFFDEELRSYLEARTRLSEDLLRGIENKEFIAYYQPQFDARTRKIIGLEALVRWSHPVQGVIGPGEFLPVAEELGAVDLIDMAVLDCAVADIEAWKRAGLTVPKISVNVSAKRISDNELIESLLAMNLPKGLITFELVESIFLDETDANLEDNIRQIKDMGIDIEIDDFGTGHASIVSLLKLSPKRLKIDRQFIYPMLRSKENTKLVESIIEIGKTLNIEVIAEGVETMEQAALLQKLGCDALQGFVFARPQAKQQIGELLRQPNEQAAS